jgi:dipeptide/tripeptide permease
MENDSEVLVTSWQEPALQDQTWGRRQVIGALCGALVLVAGFITLGWAQSDWTYYLASVGVIAGVIALIRQHLQTERSLKVQVTNARVLIGTREVSLEMLHGFYVRTIHDVAEITFVEKQRVVLPLRCLCALSEIGTTKTLLTQVLPELEPLEAPKAPSSLPSFLKRFRR